MALAPGKAATAECLAANRSLPTEPVTHRAGSQPPEVQGSRSLGTCLEALRTLSTLKGSIYLLPSSEPSGALLLPSSHPAPGLEGVSMPAVQIVSLEGQTDSWNICIPFLLPRSGALLLLSGDLAQPLCRWCLSKVSWPYLVDTFCPQQ